MEHIGGFYLFVCPVDTSDLTELRGVENQGIEAVPISLLDEAFHLFIRGVLDEYILCDRVTVRVQEASDRLLQQIGPPTTCYNECDFLQRRLPPCLPAADESALSYSLSPAVQAAHRCRDNPADSVYTQDRGRVIGNRFFGCRVDFCQDG